MAKVAVVIPTYKEELDEFEKISLAQVRKVLGKYPIVFVAPEEKIFPYLKQNDLIAQFPQKFFQSTETYTQLMLSPFFYEAFLDFDYILIYQLDAFVFYDALEEFCLLGYDYIGAPWPRLYIDLVPVKHSAVGNGGFSLRKVKAHYNLLRTRPDLVNHWKENKFPEDVFFSHCGWRTDCAFRVAPINIAYGFSAEFNPARVVRKNGGKFPFGCHDWNIRGKDFYLTNLPHFGWNLNPLSDMLKDIDAGWLNSWLTKLAFKRLKRRIERGQTCSRYLPTKKFASIRVICDPAAMKILTQLLTENNFFTDKIFLYDPENFMNLVNDLNPENLPHLLLTLEYDKSLIEHIERRGLNYDRHFVSFQQEYLKYCEQLFHNLGKSISC